MIHQKKGGGMDKHDKMCILYFSFRTLKKQAEQIFRVKIPVVINLKGGRVMKKLTMDTQMGIKDSQMRQQDSIRVMFADIRDYSLGLIILTIKKWWNKVVVRSYKHTPLTDQIKCIQNFFPWLENIDENIATWQIPANADGNFAFPDWKKIAPTYGVAVNKVLVLIKNQYGGNFKNYLEDRLGSEDHNRQSKKSLAMWENIRKEQNADIYILPVRVGLRLSADHICESANINDASKFELGVFEVGIILLTHPNRLKSFKDRWIRCGGNEFCCKANGRFNRRPFFSFISGKVRLGADLFKKMDEHCDSAVGFLPRKSVALNY